MSTLVEKWLPTIKRILAIWGFAACFGVKNMAVSKVLGSFEAFGIC
jgi:hypothetical protein